ncbi:MAG: hypothetical protein WKF89_01300 [Chitinophagaceae bacterium]
MFLFLLLIVPTACHNIKEPETFSGARGDLVELTFEFDKKTKFGEYFFDLDNGTRSTFPLCFCLTERNMFPEDCSGDINYIYNNRPGTMCVPLHIARGRCSSAVISSSAYATVFIIPLEYGWIKPVEKVVIGIRVPESAPIGAILVVRVNFFKKDDRAKLVFYEKQELSIRVKNSQPSTSEQNAPTP